MIGQVFKSEMSFIRSMRCLPTYLVKIKNEIPFAYFLNNKYLAYYLVHGKSWFRNKINDDAVSIISK